MQQHPQLVDASAVDACALGVWHGHRRQPVHHVATSGEQGEILYAHPTDSCFFPGCTQCAGVTQPIPVTTSADLDETMCAHLTQTSLFLPLTMHRRHAAHPRDHLG